jgi:hypothetical protein
MRRIPAPTFALLAATLVATTGAARAQDALSGLTPLSGGALQSVNIKDNFFNVSAASNKGAVSGNSVGADRGGQIVNGAIANNSISGNRGVTSVMMNTGNNVNFNSAMIINVIMPAGAPR